MKQPNNQQTNSDQDPPGIVDPEEFLAQYERIYPRLTLLATAIIGDRTHAEDIVQEASVIAIEKLGTFRPGSSFQAWLAEIVRRCALNYRRKTQNRKTFAADPVSMAQLVKEDRQYNESWPITGDTGKIVPDQSAFDDQVIKALNRLTEVARCCLLLRTVQKLTYAEIGEIMQIPEGTAMSHVHRSKAALRTTLEANPAFNTDSEN